MDRLKIGDLAPDFKLPDHAGKEVSLSEVVKGSNVLLVFNIGFA